MYLTDLIASGDLLAGDKTVVDLLLRYKDREAASCWTTKETIAGTLRCSERTVQRSFARLVLAGVIARRKVAIPDPEAIRNHTGYRIDFLWLQPRASTLGPDPQLLETKESREIFLPPGGGDTNDRRGETSVAPKDAGGSDCNSDSINPDLSSSSTPPVKQDDEVGLCLGENTGSGSAQDLIDAAKAYFPATTLAADIQKDAARIGKKLNQDWLAAITALAMAKQRRERPKSLIGYMLVVAKDFIADGISAEGKRAVERFNPKPAPAPSLKPPAPPRDLDAEIAEAERMLASPNLDRHMKRLWESILANCQQDRLKQADVGHA